MLNMLALPSEPVQKNVAPTTRSQQTMTQAKTWIDDCKHNHVECQREETRYDLPKRLVRVDYVKGELSASLCRGSTLSLDTQYLTLSHRWGKHEFLKLTRENIAQWEDSIPTDKLSPTFHDALYTTYSIGYRFLWIDSLCILQDDLQDWKLESEAMCRIYKGAVCNIAASARQSHGDGFLRSSRSRNPVVPPLVHVDWHASPIIPSNGVRGRDFVITETSLVDDLHDDELYGRAWLLQEQLLVGLSLLIDDFELMFPRHHVPCTVRVIKSTGNVKPPCATKSGLPAGKNH
jgi:hypothetical protein